MLTVKECAATYPAEASVFADLHKDCFGYRPRDVRFVSAEAFKAEYDRLADVVLPAAMDKEAKAHQRAIEKFEGDLKMIGAVLPNASREDLVRYLMDAEGTGDDIGYFEFKYGLPYDYVKKILA